MAHLVQADNLSEAWVQAMAYLMAQGGKAVNLNVAFQYGEENPHLRHALDAVLAELDAEREKDLWPIQTVANTIFPEALYYPHLGHVAASRLYENYELSMRLQSQCPNPYDRETYFNRLIAYPTDVGPWNQLDYYVKRLAKQATLSSQASSAYELGVSHPIDAELRVHSPQHDKRMFWFPCLSHISLTLVKGRLNMTALYRNQTFVTRAYGNYLGLARLLRFISTETATQPGEIEVVATHADAELHFGQGRLEALLEACGHAASSTPETSVSV
jgi:hypothetical protein